MSNMDTNTATNNNTNTETNINTSIIPITNENKPLAIQNPENTCFKCLQDKQVHKICIPSLGNGSYFDNFSSRVYLCDTCLRQHTNLEWWKLETIENKEDWYEIYYKYEKEILEFINTLPIQGQELFHTRFAHGDKSYMEGQDWIDYELGILPHEECDKYGYYSPQEKDAYHKQYPICDKVKIVVYEDGSKGSRCPFGTSGNKDGTSEGHQTQSGCYKCKLFVERNGEIEIMNIEDYEIYELENELALKIMLRELKNKNKENIIVE